MSRVEEVMGEDLFVSENKYGERVSRRNEGPEGSVSGSSGSKRSRANRHHDEASAKGGDYWGGGDGGAEVGGGEDYWGAAEGGGGDGNAGW